MIRLVPIIALIIAFAIALGYVEPMYSGSIATTQIAIAGDNQALAAAANYTKKESELVSAKNAIAPEDLAHLETFLPSSVDNVAIILDMNALAARSGVVLSGIGVAAQQATEQSVEQNPIGSIDLSLTVAGSYSAFRSFLKSIERSARLLDVTQFSVHGSDTGVYTYSITLRLYWLR